MVVSRCNLLISIFKSHLIKTLLMQLYYTAVPNLLVTAGVVLDWILIFNVHTVLRVAVDLACCPHSVVHILFIHRTLSNVVLQVLLR